MSLPAFHPRRAVGLAGLLSAAGLLVALKSGTATAPHKVSLGPPGPAQPSSPAGPTSAPPPGKRSVTTGRRTVLGPAVDVGYGLVQVRVTLSGNRIADLRAVQLPSGGRSSDISSYAAPQLRTEVLAAQSASIDTVSGASFTSEGYAHSVQSALDAAHR